MNLPIRRLSGLGALVLLSIAPACTPKGADDSGSVTAPIVMSNLPADGATDVARNGTISATFSEAMDPSTLTTSFTLASGDPAVAVEGTVITTDLMAVFWPSVHLDSNTDYVATISTGAMSSAAVPLAADYSWSFTTGDSLEPGLPVNLGSAADFVILAKSGVSTVPTSAVTGDIGLSPAAASYITGFSLSVDASTTFATSSQVTGRVYAADYADPTPARLTMAVSDMELAFTDAAGRAPDTTELGAGNIGSMTLGPGVYRWGTGLLVPTDLTLSGSSTDVWVFQVAQDLTFSGGVQVILAGGALPENVFWQVAGQVDLGTSSHLQGSVLTQTAIHLETGASVDGRLLAQTAVDIDGSTVVAPAH